MGGGAKEAKTARVESASLNGLKQCWPWEGEDIQVSLTAQVMRIQLGF